MCPGAGLGTRRRSAISKVTVSKDGHLRQRHAAEISQLQRELPSLVSSAVYHCYQPISAIQAQMAIFASPVTQSHSFRTRCR